MPQITCPDCHCKIELAVLGQKKHSTGPTGTRKMRAVFEFMRQIGPGTRATADLFADYCRFRQRPDVDWPDMNKMAFVRALQANGAVTWRSETARGWDIPEIPADQEPAKAAPSSRAKLMAEGYREAAARMVEPSVDVPPAPPRETALETLERLGRERREKEQADRLAAIRDLHDNPSYQ